MTDHQPHRSPDPRAPIISSRRRCAPAQMRICASDRPRRDQSATRFGQLGTSRHDDPGASGHLHICAAAPLDTCATARLALRVARRARLESAEHALTGGRPLFGGAS
jgi:hypothetical protein